MMTEWQPIETAPRDGEEFLGWFQQNGEYGRPVVCAWQPYIDLMYPWHGEWNSFAEDKITHWMPLPHPPEVYE